MEFRKFNSIKNTYDSKYIQKLGLHGYAESEIEWIAQEKLHGANLGVYCDGMNAQLARRTDLMTPTEAVQFFNMGAGMVDHISDLAFTLLDIVIEKVGHLDYIIQYGELIGGSYNHPEVPRSNHAAKIANKHVVAYTPEHEFVTFDIWCVPDIDHPENGFFMTYDDVVTVCDTIGALYSRAMFRGTLEECLSLPNIFESQFFEELGLPQCESNPAEGLVIRPVKSLFMGESRAILKYKHPDHGDIKQPSVKVNHMENVSDDFKRVFAVAETYVTDARLNSAQSKLGEITRFNLGEAIREVGNDVMRDFSSDNPDMIKMLPKSERKLMSREISRISRNLVVANVGEVHHTSVIAA